MASGGLLVQSPSHSGANCLVENYKCECSEEAASFLFDLYLWVHKRIETTRQLQENVWKEHTSSS